MSNKTEFMQALIKNLVREHSFDASLAEDMVNSSVLNDLYDEMPEFVEHYSIDHWAKQVISENTMIAKR